MSVPAWHSNPLTTMIMKKNVLLYMVAVAGLVLAGCNKTDAPEAGSLNMTVKASIGTLTRVSYDGASSAFEKGDKFSVYAWTGDAGTVPAKKVVDGVVNTLGEDGKWYPEIQMLWKTIVDPHYFIGIYPARKVNDFKADTYVQLPLDYEASDLLIATNVSGVKASDGAVALDFDHAMAKLQVHLNFRSQWNDTWGPVPGKEAVEVAVKARTAGTVDYLSKTISAAAAAEIAALPLPALATAAAGYTYSYSNLIIPQEDVTEIDVTIGGKVYVYNHSGKDGISLEKGKVTSIGLIVGREQLDLGGITVEDWAEGTTYPEDGEAMEEEKPSGVIPT